MKNIGYGKSVPYVTASLALVLFVNILLSYNVYSSFYRAEQGLNALVYEYKHESGQSCKQAIYKQIPFTGSNSVSERGDTSQNESVWERSQEEISRLKLITDFSGLNELVEMEGFDSEVFQELIYHQVRKQRLEDNRNNAKKQALMELEKHGSELIDFNLQIKYGKIYQMEREEIVNMKREELSQIYKDTHMLQKEALENLIARYPDSYTAAANTFFQAILAINRTHSHNNLLKNYKKTEKPEEAEMYLRKLEQGTYYDDTESAEKYYSLLKNYEENNSKLFLYNGTEAVPELELCLARLYYARGETDNFYRMIDTLDLKYSDQNIISRTVSGRNELLTVPEAVEYLLDSTVYKKKSAN